MGEDKTGVIKSPPPAQAVQSLSDTTPMLPLAIQPNIIRQSTEKQKEIVMKVFGNPRKVSYIYILKYIRITLHVLILLLRVINLLFGTNNLFNL